MSDYKPKTLIGVIFFGLLGIIYHTTLLFIAPAIIFGYAGYKIYNGDWQFFQDNPLTIFALLIISAIGLGWYFTNRKERKFDEKCNILTDKQQQFINSLINDKYKTFITRVIKEIENRHSYLQNINDTGIELYECFLDIKNTNNIIDISKNIEIVIKTKIPYQVKSSVYKIHREVFNKD